MIQTKRRGHVALVNSEEKILPTGTGYFLCTVGSMPSVESVPVAARIPRRRRRRSFCEAGRPRTEQQAADKRKCGRKPNVSDHSVNPNVVANPTGPGSRIMTTRQGWVQGYTARAAVTRDQIIHAADITNAANHVQQLGGTGAD